MAFLDVPRGMNGTGEGGALLHAAMEAKKPDWAVIESIITTYGAAATCAKNRCGSTPLMLAAGGKCGNKLNRVLVDTLLANGAGASAAEVSNR